MNSRIRIKDIAEEAGVSKGTVDRVIHNRGNVSPEAKERVLAAMKELQYEPNHIASALAYNRNWRIATILPKVTNDSFWQQPHLGIERARSVVRDYGFLVDNYKFDGGSSKDFLVNTEKILAQNYDAVLTAPIFLQEAHQFFDRCEERQIPYVQINTYIDRNSEYALFYIGQDSYQSGVLAAKLLNFGLSEGETALILHLEKSVINSAHLLEKEKGFEDYFSQHQESKIFTAKASFYNLQDRQQFKKFIIYMLKSYPNVKGIYVTTSRLFHLVSILEELQINHLKLVGYDLIEENLECLRKEKIDFLINQNPIKQGYMGIIGLMNHFLYKRENPQIQHLPLDIVMKENVTYYLLEQQLPIIV